MMNINGRCQTERNQWWHAGEGTEASGIQFAWTCSKNCTYGASGVVKKEASDRVSDSLSDMVSDAWSDTFPPLVRHS